MNKVPKANKSKDACGADIKTAVKAGTPTNTRHRRAFFSSCLDTPLVLGADGDKLSKQNGAQALDVNHPLAALNAAAAVLGLPTFDGTCEQALAYWAGSAIWGR